MKHYKAPWSKWLIGVSTFLTMLCVGIGIVMSQLNTGAISWLAWLPIGLAIGCALFMIRGYTITTDTILVHRLWWATELPRRGLESAQLVPNAMRGSIRVFGNGGFFSFSGFFWNKPLGSYRAYVTDPASTVVLRYASRRPILLSPATPEEFIHDLGRPRPDRE